MSRQNIYDDETFFAGYQAIRKNANNANDLFETPALLSLLPDLVDKAVLDLGCGCGDHCAEYARRGARRVLGIDISEKMLAVARAKNADPRVEYRRMAMEDIGTLNGFRGARTACLRLAESGRRVRVLAGAPDEHLLHHRRALDAGRTRRKAVR